MSAMTDDLVKRLLRMGADDPSPPRFIAREVQQTARESADALTAARAEIERLQALLTITETFVEESHDRHAKELSAALTKNAALCAEIEVLSREQIIAPAECTSNCDDPECPYTHNPLMLLQAYENSLSRLRAAESENERLTRERDDLAGAKELLIERDETMDRMLDERATLRADLEKAHAATDEHSKALWEEIRRTDTLLFKS